MNDTTFKAGADHELQSEIYDNLTLHNSQLEMIQKLVRTALHDITRLEEAPYFAIKEVKKTLSIAQYLIDEFDYSLSKEIEAHPLYKMECRYD